MSIDNFLKSVKNSRAVRSGLAALTFLTVAGNVMKAHAQEWLATNRITILNRSSPEPKYDDCFFGVKDGATRKFDNKTGFDALKVFTPGVNVYSTTDDGLKVTRSYISPTNSDPCHRFGIDYKTTAPTSAVTTITGLPPNLDWWILIYTNSSRKGEPRIQRVQNGIPIGLATNELSNIVTPGPVSHISTKKNSQYPTNLDVTVWTDFYCDRTLPTLDLFSSTNPAGPYVKTGTLLRTDDHYTATASNRPQRVGYGRVSANSR